MVQKFNTAYILGITLISALGGLLFGYDWVVIGGAKPFYEAYFGISKSPSLQGWAMSSALVGCIFGATFSAKVSDKYGRKPSLLLAAILFSVSAIGTGFATNLTLFIGYRLLGGLGIGLASTQSPMYIAEISPGKIRGKFVALNQFTIVTGILAAQLINYLIASSHDNPDMEINIINSWNGQYGWRWMFWVETIPAFLFLIMTFLIPESPRWLAKNKKWEQSEKILGKIGGLAYAKESITEIRNSFRSTDNKLTWEGIRQPEIKPILILGIGLAIFQQWCGINVIFNYAEEIFTAAGYTVSDIMFNIVLTGLVNVVFTIIAMYTVDRWGRKNLMLTGAGGLAVTYIILGSLYFFEVEGILVVIIVIAAIAIYAMTLAPVTWVILSEIFPNKVRSSAMAIATTFLWIACFLLTYTFPVFNSWLNASGTFWLYALICLSGFIFILKNLKETKGKSLEEIETIMKG